MRSLQKNNRRRVPKDSLRSVSKEFAEATSMHGLKFISQDDASLPERILWVVLFCVGFFFAVGFSWKLWDNWQNSPVLITIQSANYPISKYPFPAVTFCSVNKVSTRALETWLSSQPSNFNLDKIRSILQILSTNRVDTQEDVVALSDLMARAKINTTKKNYESFVKSVSPNCTDMAIYCTWEDKEEECNQLFATEATDNGYCCSFNSVILSNDGKETVSSDKLRHAKSSGVYAGLSVILDATIDDYNVTSALFTGFKVSIQDPEDFPRTGRIGFMVSPGHQIEVTVTGQTQISNDRLETIGLDKRLCAADGEIKLKYFDRYTGPFCNLDCIIELFLNQCLCVPFYFPVSDHLPVCTLSAYPCLEKVSLFVTVNSSACHCPDLCNNVWYQTAISSGNGPNPVAEYPPVLLKRIPKFRNMTKSQFNVYAKNNIVKLNVFFKSITGLCYIMEQRTTWADFISAAGGLLGLGFGFSILSAAELLYFFLVRWFYYWYRAKVKSRAVDQILAAYQQEQSRLRMPFYNARPLSGDSVIDRYSSNFRIRN